MKKNYPLNKPKRSVGNKNKVTFWLVTIHDLCYFGRLTSSFFANLWGSRRTLEGHTFRVILERLDPVHRGCQSGQNFLSQACWETSGDSCPQKTIPTWSTNNGKWNFKKTWRFFSIVLNYMQSVGPGALQYKRENFSLVTQSWTYFDLEIYMLLYLNVVVLFKKIVLASFWKVCGREENLWQ